MCRNSTITILITSFIFCFCQVLTSQIKNELQLGGSLGKNVNAPKEDYASWVIYAQVPNAFDTLFFTSARPLVASGLVRKDRTASVFFSVRDPNIRIQSTLPINEGWSGALPYQNTGSLNRSTHGASVMLAGGRSVLAGERDISQGSAVGTSYMLDLFELQRNDIAYSRYDEVTKGPVNDKRITINTISIDVANTDSTWESQPTVSIEGAMNEPTHGKTLFFVSNRPEFPGDSTDDMNIWFIQRTIQGQWSVPKLVPGINTPGDEISPHCAADGKFYFASDWDYVGKRLGNRGRDIFRCDYRDSAGILLPTAPVNLDVALANDLRRFGVNTQTRGKGGPNLAFEKPTAINSDSDDCFPFITPDGRFIFLTSNRKGAQELDLYAFSIPRPRIRLRVDVREIEVDANGKPLSEPRLLEGVSVAVLNNNNNGVFKTPSSTNECFLDPDRTYTLSLDTLLKEHCYTNSLRGDERITFTTKQPLSADTLYVREFTILKQQKPIPTLEFVPTGALAFFITGYWKPTTRANLVEFRGRHLAGFFKNTIYVDSTDLKAAEAETKNKRLASAAPTAYKNYDDVAAAIDVQFEREFGKFADALASVETLRFWEERVNCGRDTIFLKLTVRGFTDRRGLRDGYYGDVPVIGKDRTGKLIQIPTGDRIMRQTSALPDSGQRGNIKLSILRARFMAEAFHSFMLRRDSSRNIYRYLAENNRIMPPEIVGMGFDKERYAQTGEENDLYSRRIEMSFELVRRSSRPSAQLTQNVSQAAPVLEPTPIQPTLTQSGPVQVSSTVAVVSIPTTAIITSATTETEPIAPELAPLLAPLALTLNELSMPKTAVNDTAHTASSLTMSETSLESGRCYTVLYTSLEGNKQEALRLRDLLLARKVSDARVDVYINPIGKRFYRVCSGCFVNDYEAFAYLKTLPSMREVLNITAKPVVIRM